MDLTTRKHGCMSFYLFFPTRSQAPEVAVIGVADKMRGEVPNAYIALREQAVCSEEEPREHCLKKLPRYKVPRFFEFLKELPHIPTDKVLKKALKQ